jgi:hypothetical protein
MGASGPHGTAPDPAIIEDGADALPAGATMRLLGGPATGSRPDRRSGDRRRAAFHHALDETSRQDGGGAALLNAVWSLPVAESDETVPRRDPAHGRMRSTLGVVPQERP